MNRSLLIAIIAVVVLLLGGALFAMNRNNKSTPTPSPSPTTNTSTTPPASNNESTSGTTTPPETPPSASSANIINIKNNIFSPSQITVKKGEAVTWTNNDTVAHTVTDDLSDVGGPNSGTVEPGQSYTFTFEKTGSFQYHCKIHTSMRGTIVVQ